MSWAKLLDGYEFPTNSSSWLKLKNDVSQWTEPSFKTGKQTGKKSHPYEQVHYTAKIAGSDNEYFWAKLTNGSYLPYAKKTALKHIRKLPRPQRYELIGGVLDKNTEQPFEQLDPYIQAVRPRKVSVGKRRSTNALVNYVRWERDEPIEIENLNVPFEPTAAEKDSLAKFYGEVSTGMRPGDVLIAYITDTHVDTHQTAATARVLHSMRLMSYFATKYHVDLVIHGGDMNDGSKPKQLSVYDMQLGIKAIQESQRPYIILAGNHDDNSGYVRDISDNLVSELITNQEANKLRVNPFLQIADNPNGSIYGRYDIPNSKVTIIVLDGFDQKDVIRNQDDELSFGSYRHGYTRYTHNQLEWLEHELKHRILNDRKVLFVNHISLNGVDEWVNHFDLGGKWHSQEGYNNTLFENNTTTNPGGVNQSHRVFQKLTKFQRDTQNVIGYLSGHTHFDNYAFINGIWFVTQTSAVADRGDGAEPRRNRKHEHRSIMGIDNNAWSVLRISPDTGEVNQYRFGWKNPNYFLSHWQFDK